MDRVIALDFYGDHVADLYKIDHDGFENDLYQPDGAAEQVSINQEWYSVGADDIAEPLCVEKGQSASLKAKIRTRSDSGSGTLYLRGVDGADPTRFWQGNCQVGAGFHDVWVELGENAVSFPDRLDSRSLGLGWFWSVDGTAWSSCGSSGIPLFVIWEKRDQPRQAKRIHWLVKDLMRVVGSKAHVAHLVKLKLDARFSPIAKYHLEPWKLLDYESDRTDCTTLSDLLADMITEYLGMGSAESTAGYATTDCNCDTAEHNAEKGGLLGFMLNGIWNEKEGCVVFENYWYPGGSAGYYQDSYCMMRSIIKDNGAQKYRGNPSDPIVQFPFLAVLPIGPGCIKPSPAPPAPAGLSPCASIE